MLHPDLLGFCIRPQEPQPDLLGNLLQDSARTHAKRMGLSLMVYVLLQYTYVYLPSVIINRLGIGGYCRIFRPTFCYLFSHLQIPVEIFVFHLSMLAFLERFKNKIGEFQHSWTR